jgi:hypothetical protein
LSFSGRLKVLVQFGAIELITTMCYRGVLQTALTAEQIKWIRTKLEGLSVTDDTLLKDAIEEFEECDADD